MSRGLLLVPCEKVQIHYMCQDVCPELLACLAWLTKHVMTAVLRFPHMFAMSVLVMD